MPQARRRLSRKAEILLELLAAGDAAETRIKAHSAEVDDLMLQLLQRRIEAAERCASLCDPSAHPAPADMLTQTLDRNLIQSSPQLPQRSR